MYQRLQLSLSTAFEEHLTAEGARHKRYRSSNTYSLEEFGIEPQELEKKLEPLIQRFDFHPSEPAKEAVREML